MGAMDEALSTHYREHGGAVRHVATRICGSELAADVTQEVFSQLWRNPGAFDPTRGTMRTFLVTAARHRAIDLLRAERSRRVREVRSHPVPPAPSDVDHGHLRNEVADRVHAALWALPPLERDAIIAAFYGECTSREVALALGAPEGTIKSRIRSGLQRLRMPLGDLAASPTPSPA
jgi:RNA polymerase sigma-70 factor (ECF subfamily)